MRNPPKILVRDVFGIDTEMRVKGFAERSDRVPEVDHSYKFDPDTTLAILAGFAYNRRVTLSLHLYVPDCFVCWNTEWKGPRTMIWQQRIHWRTQVVCIPILRKKEEK